MRKETSKKFAKRLEINFLFHPNIDLVNKSSFPCDICGEIFTSDTSRVAHVGKKHPGMPFKCLVCQMTKKTRQLYKHHRNLQNKKHFVAILYKIFKSKTSLTLSK